MFLCTFAYVIINTHYKCNY